MMTLLVVLAVLGAVATLTTLALVANDLWNYHRGGRSVAGALITRDRLRRQGYVGTTLEWDEPDGSRARLDLGPVARVELVEGSDA